MNVNEITDVAQAYDDLAWLREHGALDGVAEIIRERRRQIEKLGYTPEQDRQRYADGWLMGLASRQLSRCDMRERDGLAGPGDREHAMAACGALAAAEIDRLQAEFGEPS